MKKILKILKRKEKVFSDDFVEHFIGRLETPAQKKKNLYEEIFCDHKGRIIKLDRKDIWLLTANIISYPRYF